MKQDYIKYLTPFFLAVLIATSTQAQLFSGAANYTIGNSGSVPRSLAIGDLNGDGKPDLAVTNRGDDNVSVLINTGIGGFSPRVNYLTGSSPRSVAIGDLNGDGRPDLAVANAGNSTVRILTSTGIGSFDAAGDYNMSSPYDIAIGDLNGDGRPDLAVVDVGNSTVRILTSTGIGTFAAVGNYTTSNIPRSVAIDDLNGDGRLDIAVATEDASVSVFTNSGFGTFGTKVDYSVVGFQERSVAIGDLNGDGRPDLAVTNRSDNSVSVLTSTGMGTFGIKVDYSTGTSSFPRSVAIGDFNGDGRLDLAVGVENPGAVLLLTSTGFGTFAAAGRYSLPAGSPDEVAIGDLNGDGRPDLAVATSSSNVSVLLAVNYPIQTTSATLTGGNIISILGNSTTLTSAFSPSFANTNTVLGWNTTLNGIASFNTVTGVLMALQNGDGVVAIQSRYTTITSNIVLITITNNKINQTITGLPSSIVSIVGFSTNLPSTVTSGLPLSYTSTNNSFASVSGSVLSFYATGVATITASNLGNLTFNGISQSFVVTVLSNIFPVVSANIFGSNTISIAGGTTQLTSDYLPSNANSNTVLGWSVSNTSIATISGTGLLQALNNGVVTVIGSYGTVTGIKVVTISGQCLPYNLTVSSSNTSVCPIENIGFTATGANSYTWNNGLNNGTSNTAAFNPTVSGIITFVGTNSFGCTSTGFLSYTVNAVPIILTQPQSTTYTAGNFATLNVFAIGSNLSYLWSNGITTAEFSTTIVGSYQVTISGVCGSVVSQSATVTRFTNRYVFVPEIIEMSVGDTVSLEVKTLSTAPLVYSISDATIAQLEGNRLVGLVDGEGIVLVSQPATQTSDALPVVNIPLKVSAIPSRNFDIIGSVLVPIGSIIIYSQPSVVGFTYTWSFSGTGVIIVPGTENSPNFEIIFLSNASPGNVICIVKDKNQNIVSNKSLRVSTLSSEESELAKSLSKVDCPPEVTDCKNAYITDVAFGKLKNLGTGCSRAGFGDFTVGLTLDSLLMGDSYDLSLGSVAEAGKSSFFAVWIDYNNNGKFTDQDDFLAASFENASKFEIKNIIIKNQTEYEGPRRMRVSMRADAVISPTDPCAKTGGSGETEDYLVFIRKPDELQACSFISPNKDGKNDNFIIRGINPKESNKLIVMDRYGSLVYEKENYANDWDGKNSKNNELTEGTYYYQFINGENEIKGFVEVKRK